MTTAIASSIADRLRAYVLPDGVLPLAPTRTPFSAYSVEALVAVAGDLVDFPERRGAMSHAVRALRGAPHAVEPGESVTLEAHLDATSVPQPLADDLAKVGFELDGFVEFVPAHFSDHFTCKFKVAKGQRERRSELLTAIDSRCARAVELLAAWPSVEAYVELECWGSENRRRWAPSPPRSGWVAQFPLSDGGFRRVLPPCTPDESAEAGVPIDIEKRADIHVKVCRPASAAVDDLVARMIAGGFYPVRTWAGNLICTAQFRHAADARRVFEALGQFFDLYGGAMEMTLEPVRKTWRTTRRDGHVRRLAALPPLVLNVE